MANANDPLLFSNKEEIIGDDENIFAKHTHERFCNIRYSNDLEQDKLRHMYMYTLH